MFEDGECEEGDEEGAFTCANEEMTFTCTTPTDCCFDAEGDDMPNICCAEEGCCLTDDASFIDESFAGMFICFNEDAEYFCESAEIGSFEDCEAFPAGEFMY